MTRTATMMLAAAMLAACMVLLSTLLGEPLP
jgi:hypothetical protein